jgi:hypothetical protein
MLAPLSANEERTWTQLFYNKNSHNQSSFACKAAWICIRDTFRKCCLTEGAVVSPSAERHQHIGQFRPKNIFEDVRKSISSAYGRGTHVK